MTSITGKMNKYGRSSHLRCSSPLSSAADRSNSLLSGGTTGRGANKPSRPGLRGRKFTALEQHAPPSLVAEYEKNTDIELEPVEQRIEEYADRKCDMLKHYHGYSPAARRRAAGGRWRESTDIG
jgi:hypothetical protein